MTMLTEPAAECKGQTMAAGRSRTRSLAQSARPALAVLIGLMVATASLGGAPARAASERETLIGRCWIGGIPAASPLESKPQKASRNASIAHAANASAPQRQLAAFSPIAPRLRGAIRRVELRPGSKKLIALTFDMCEQTGEIAGYDGAIIDYLREKKIKATLFTGGKWLVTHGERAEQLIAHPQFEIGNHGWTHRNTRLIAGQALQEEILKPQAAYEEARARFSARQCVIGQERTVSAIPKRLALYRFPFGSCNADALKTVADAGMLAIQWDVASGDPSPSVSAEAMTQSVLRTVKPGSILIFHANGRGHHTGAALPVLIPKLKAQGYEFVTVSELLAAGTPVIASTCYDHRPGDTDKYDFLFNERGKGAAIPNATKPAHPAPSASGKSAAVPR